MMHTLTSLLLCMTIAVTSVTVAQARGMDPAVDRIVICTGLNASVIYVNAEGQPTHGPHACPDCMMPAADMLGQAAFTLGAAPSFRLTTTIGHMPHLPDSPQRMANARAPPFVI